MITHLPQEDLLRFGNELEMSGIVFANGQESHTIMFPEATFPLPTNDYKLSEIGWKQLLDQLDTLNIEGIDKTILRKSQRQIEQGVSWAVYRRDNYTCQYCARNDVPLTVDHIVIWEQMGDSVEGNLITSCRKCNKTRGSKSFGEWLQDKYLLKMLVNFGSIVEIKEQVAKLEALHAKALLLPLRKSERSKR